VAIVKVEVEVEVEVGGAFRWLYFYLLFLLVILAHYSYPCFLCHLMCRYIPVLFPGFYRTMIDVVGINR
ncbi:hypothetical protein C7212DRAFT_315122, partial [Tuber magnatum]